MIRTPLSRSTAMAALPAAALVLSLAACTPAAPTNPTSQNGAAPTLAVADGTAALTPTLAAAAVVTSTAAVTDAAPAELPAGAAPPTLADIGVTDAATGTFESVVILPPISDPSGQPMWVAHTTGARGYDPGGPHVVAVLARTAEAWRLVDRMELGGDAKTASATPDPDAYFGPDYLAPDGVAAANVEPTHLWLTVEGGIGAHGGSFAMLSFDGTKLKLEAHASNGFPGVGRVEDLDGDGVGEVILDRTDAYVFCYACGVRAASVDVLKWDGDQLQSIVLHPVAGADAMRYALDAVAGGFWETAAALAQLALQSPNSTPPSTSDAPPKSHQDMLNDQEDLRNNSMVIKANRDARAALIGSDDPYPILHLVFFGDWPGAVDLLRAFAPERLFALDSPLVVGTPAEGNLPALSERIGAAAGSALNYGPKLQGAPSDFRWDPAPAIFLRGWSAWLAAPGDAAARADIAEAAALSPDDALYTASAAWIADQP